jgi:hypothetical protein
VEVPVQAEFAVHLLVAVHAQVEFAARQLATVEVAKVAFVEAD